jgi:hypothetical protein
LFRTLCFVLCDRALHQDGQRLIGEDAAQPRFGVAGLGDLFGVTGVVGGGVQDAARD